MKDKEETITFRISKEMKDKLMAQAEKEGRSLSNLIVHLLSKAMKHNK